MTALAASAPPKLPVWQTVGACYATVGGNLGQLVRMSWLWLLIMIPVYGLAYWLALREWEIRDGQTMHALMRELLGLLPFVVELPFLASIAVAWHRLVLCQERVTQPAYLRLDTTVWLYASYSLVFLVLIQAPLTVFLVLRSEVKGATPLWLLTVLLLAIAFLAIWVSLLVLPRFSLVLPAVALGERLSLGQAWRITRRNALRLTLATCLCLVPVELLLVLPLLWLLLVSRASSENLGQLLGSLWIAVPMSLAYTVLIIFAVTLLSLTYRFFAGPRTESASPPA